MNDNMYDAMYQQEEKNWWFRGKRDIILRLIDSLKLDKTARVLDVGCGTGIFLKCLSEKFEHLSGVDYSDRALEYCRKNFDGPLAQTDISQPFGGGETYDLILASDVLEHVEQDREALKNIKNCLTEQGCFVATVPAFPCLWTAHDKNCNHCRRYTMQSLGDAAKAAGLTVEYMSYYNFYLFLPIFLLRMLFKLLPIDRNSNFENSASKGAINSVLYRIFSSEKSRIEKRKRFPFGVSLITVLRNEGSK